MLCQMIVYLNYLSTVCVTDMKLVAAEPVMCMYVQRPIWKSRDSFQDDIEETRHRLTLLTVSLTVPFIRLQLLTVCRHDK